MNWKAYIPVSWTAKMVSAWRTENALDSFYREALKKVPFAQTWPGHFLAKRTETEIILRYLDSEPNKTGLGLDIGCGNAFQSVLMAGFTKKFIASDLFDRDGSSHTIGMTRAKSLIEGLNKDVLLVSCSSLALPFSDDSFDFVFSSSAIEHIDDKDLAIREIRRVLKPGGRSVVVVPTHVPSLYAFIHVYLYCLARLIKLCFNPVGGSKKADRDSKVSLAERFLKNHTSFPLPEPHGSYGNVFKELISQLPFNWERSFLKNGLKIRRSFGICIFPWLLIEPFSTMAAARIYSLTKSLNIRLASLRLLKYFSHLMCVIAEKE